MRIIALVVAGAVGGLWFAVRTPADPPPATPVGRPRAAHLESLATQIARARSAEVANDRAEISPPTPALTGALELPEITSTIGLDARLRALPRGQRLSALEEALGHALAVEDQLLLGLEDDDEEEDDDGEPTIEPEPPLVIDMTGLVGHEVIQLEDHAPLIDPTVISNCGAMFSDYRVEIPIPATLVEPE